jgi:hypothetical protein
LVHSGHCSTAVGIDKLVHLLLRPVIVLPYCILHCLPTLPKHLHRQRRVGLGDVVEVSHGKGLWH